MGLAVEVGMLVGLIGEDEEGAQWTREAFAKINEVLKENGYAEHNEPEQLPVLSTRANIIGFPYSFIHYLRRLYAHTSFDPDWVPTPTPENTDPSDDPVVFDEASMMSSHLLCHSDCEGYYMPIEFEEVIFADPDDDRVPGGMLGSSYALRAELIEVAPKLEITLNGTELSDAEVEKINQYVEAEETYWIEKVVWLALFEATRLSIEHKTAVCFC